MHYDVAIIGAGMSGLAAGIRCAYFDKRVCIFERHEVYGGLNSFYRLEGREFDVGLHAVTNYAPPRARTAPLAKLFRQLRLSRDEFQLHPQGWSEVRFPGARLRFSNGVELLRQEVAAVFPRQIDGFQRLVEVVAGHDVTAPERTGGWARAVLAEHLSDPLLIEMLLCPILYYGSPREHDLEFGSFATLFQAIFLEGMARPRDGVRVILKALIRKYRECGGKLRTRCGVRRLRTDGQRVTVLELDTDEEATADVVLSSAGLFETMRLCSDAEAAPPAGEVGRVSFLESICCLDVTPARLGHEAAIVFFNDSERFVYARPDDLVDVRSGVICCPTNFQGHEDLPEGPVRMTCLANYDRWAALDEPAGEVIPAGGGSRCFLGGQRESLPSPDARYAEAKRRCHERLTESVVRFIPDFRPQVVFTDTFTPRTIQRYTGHLGGAVYGSASKVPDGRTRLRNLFVCGTDQGLVGIVGALLSGISMANRHVLSGE